MSVTILSFITFIIVTDTTIIVSLHVIPRVFKMLHQLMPKRHNLASTSSLCYTIDTKLGVSQSCDSDLLQPSPLSLFDTMEHHSVPLKATKPQNTIQCHPTLANTVYFSWSHSSVAEEYMVKSHACLSTENDQIIWLHSWLGRLLYESKGQWIKSQWK